MPAGVFLAWRSRCTGCPGRAPWVDPAAQVAVVGTQADALACAHWLARLGHAVVLFESSADGDGLARYKCAGGGTQHMARWLLAQDGIAVRRRQSLHGQAPTDALLSGYAAVYLGDETGDADAALDDGRRAAQAIDAALRAAPLTSSRSRPGSPCSRAP